MPDIDINGINVKFPFEPYPVQRKYMSKVIQCLENSQNGMLESPTGTGKTLSLLCSTLGWVRHNKVEETPPPTVIYASRTHSQIAQCMEELKSSDYNDVEAIVIGSRDQLCIHPDLKGKSNSDKILECKNLRKRTKCEYHKNFVEHSKQNEPEYQKTIMDIEDLLRAGLKHECCPYYVAKEKATRMKVIFMPYNYLIDPLIRGAVLKDIEMKNAIVIMDEAHNVPNVCESSASSQISSTQIIIALKEMKFVVGIADDNFKKFEIEKKDAYNLKTSLHKLLSFINRMQLDNNGTNIQTGNYIFTLLSEAHIAESDTMMIEKMIEILFDNRDHGAPAGVGLNAVLGFLQIIFTSAASHLKDRIDSYYRVYIENETCSQSQIDDESDPPEGPKGPAVEESRKTVNFWCFSPAFGIQNIVNQDIRSLILTSGTLSPFQPIINELQIPVPITLSNSHVIKRFQVHAEIAEVGVKNTPMDGRFENRDNKKYINSLGESIVEFAKVVPDGLLIFFKSYTAMEDYHKFWQGNSIWEKICEQKPIFVEPRDKKELKPMIQAYNTSIKQNKGAIFMAVLRGKVSEGLDFADMYGRGVVIIGIPYGPKDDPKVLLKKECLNRNRTRENQLPSGDEWYRLEAIRAVNQAIGRVIRHKNDYGAIILLDEQFNKNIIQADISKWIKSHLSNQPSYPIPFAAIIDGLKNFFMRAELSLLPKPKLQEPEPDLSDDDEPNLIPRIKAELIKIEPGTLPPLEADSIKIETESMKIEPMDFDWNDYEDDGMLVALHERKRKTGANSPVTNDENASEPEPSTSTVCNGIKSEDLKRKRMKDNLDINMNDCNQDESKSMDEEMP